MPDSILPEHDENDLIAEMLSGDLRDRVLERIRSLDKPWAKLSEAEQRSLNLDVEYFVADLVRRAVRLVAAEGRPTILASVESVTFKDGIKAVLTVNKSNDQRHALADAQGDTVLIVVADAEEFIGERAPPLVEKDQGEIPIGEPEDPAVFDATEQGADAEAENKPRGRKRRAP